MGFFSGWVRESGLPIWRHRRAGLRALATGRCRAAIVARCRVSAIGVLFGNRWWGRGSLATVAPLPTTERVSVNESISRWTEVAGLLAAVCWALGGLLFSRIPVSAGALNLGKNFCGGVLLALVVFLRPGGLESLASYTTAALWWLVGSSLIGILIGDGSYLRSLQLLGPRRALILSMLVPVFAAGFGWFVLAESLAGQQLIGIAVTLAGVAIVIRERNPGVGTEKNVPTARARYFGTLHGLNAALCQAVGSALTKKGMEGHDPLDPEASLIRLAAAVVGGIVFAFLGRRLRRWWRELSASGIPTRVFLASTLGTFCGIWLSLIAIGSLPIAVANTQTSTTPIFMTIFVAVILKEKVSTIAWGGTLLGLIGVILLIQGGASVG